MKDRQPLPGVSRTERLSDEGLQRLERQLAAGSQISDAVLAQWLRRYGESARAVIMQGWSAVMRCRIRIEMKQAC